MPIRLPALNGARPPSPTTSSAGGTSTPWNHCPCSRRAREILTETTVLSFVGGVGGVLLAIAGIRLAVSLGIDALPLGADTVFDSRTGLAAILASVTVGLGIGLPILWLHLRGSTNLSLQTETRGATTSHAAQ